MFVSGERREEEQNEHLSAFRRLEEGLLDHQASPCEFDIPEPQIAVVQQAPQFDLWSVVHVPANHQ
jgi:hypothetical protein